MITEKQIAEILSLYKKHGWNLSRVLLSAELEKNLSDKTENLFGTAEIDLCEIDAVWFTRPSKDQNTAWELRHLSDAPFALFEVFDSETEENFIEEKLLEMEEQMIEKFN
ncbi:MAG: hypothetical protein ABIP06_05045 [Pyrinomonadaceae bacterium]